MRGFWIIVAAIVIASLAAGLLIGPYLPERMVTHWNFSGQPDGWMDKPLALAALPVVMLVLAFLLDYLPRLDPRSANLSRFHAVYEQFILVLMLFLAALHLTVLAWAGGLTVSPIAIVSLGLALLLFFVARLCEASHPNYFIGIRTPWALEDEGVWYATNRLAARLYYWAVPVCLLGILIPAYAILFILVAVLVPSAVAVAYSYLLYARRHGNMKTRKRKGRR